MEELENIARGLVAPSKGILAADESTPTITKRFVALNLTSTPELNRKYREMLISTPEIEKYLSGIIFYDETVKQMTSPPISEAPGFTFPEYLQKRGITPGIKVDEGKEVAPDSPNESLTKGVETLRDRLKEYKKMGLKFAKWRAEIIIAPALPSDEVVVGNARRMAQYAKICQEEGFVPIVEPEVTREGAHDLARCEEVTKQVLTSTFSEIEKAGVNLKAMLLKTNMVTSGKESGQTPSPKEVSDATLRVLGRVLPEELAGVVFLSGGQTPDEATQNLNEINKFGSGYSWPLSFSFARALQNEAMEVWRGEESNVKAAQEAFLSRLKLVSLAREGKI